MPESKVRKKSGDDIETLADRLHAAAIRLLRRLRKSDEAMGLSAPQASALSVLTFGGPQTLNGLAEAEQVRAPTMSRLVAELERGGLATKTIDTNDRRVVRIAATVLGRRLLEEGRARRLATLKAELANLSKHERAELTHAVGILERLGRPPQSAAPQFGHRPKISRAAK